MCEENEVPYKSGGYYYRCSWGGQKRLKGKIFLSVKNPIAIQKKRKSYTLPCVLAVLHCLRQVPATIKPAFCSMYAMLLPLVPWAISVGAWVHRAWVRELLPGKVH